MASRYVSTTFGPVYDPQPTGFPAAIPGPLRWTPSPQFGFGTFVPPMPDYSGYASLLGAQEQPAEDPRTAIAMMELQERARERELRREETARKHRLDYMDILQRAQRAPQRRATVPSAEAIDRERDRREFEMEMLRRRAEQEGVRESRRMATQETRETRAMQREERRAVREEAREAARSERERLRGERTERQMAGRHAAELERQRALYERQSQMLEARTEAGAEAKERAQDMRLLLEAREQALSELGGGGSSAEIAARAREIMGEMRSVSVPRRPSEARTPQERKRRVGELLREMLRKMGR